MDEDDIMEWLRNRGIDPKKDYLSGSRYNDLLEIVKKEALERGKEAAQEMVEKIEKEMGKESLNDGEGFINKVIGHGVLEHGLLNDGNLEEFREAYGAQGMPEDIFIDKLVENVSKTENMQYLKN